MKSIIQDMKHNYFVNAVIMVLLGLVLVIWPHILGVLLCYLLGGALIVMGVFQLISFLRGERLGFYNKFVMMMGIVLVLLGIWICLIHLQHMRLRWFFWESPCSMMAGPIWRFYSFLIWHSAIPIGDCVNLKEMNSAIYSAASEI